MIRKQTRLKASRRGVAAVEFALIAPLMMLFVFGLFEIGRISMVKDSAVHATREGARIGVKPSATNAEVTARVQEELALIGVPDATIEVTPTLNGQMTPGQTVRVSVSIPLDVISLIPGFFNFGGENLTAETSMRRESTD